MIARHLPPVGSVEELVADDADQLAETIDSVRAVEAEGLAAARAEVALLVATYRMEFNE